MPAISVISVNYKSTALLNAHETRLSSFDIEYVVVDNSGEFIPNDPRTKVLATGRNIGFGQACNLGVRRSTGEIVIFLNPDALIEQESFDRFLSVCEQQSDDAIWGPFLRDHLGQVVVLQRPGILGLSFRRRSLTVEELAQDTIDVTYISGACMAVQRSFFEAIGGFASDIFLYGEDLDLCFRAKAAGARVFLTGSAEVSHKGGGSSTRLDRAKRLLRSTRGHFSFLRRHGYSPLGATLNAIHLASGRRI